MLFGDVALQLVTRLLPREFRRRVFEPAFADLRIEEQRAGRSRSPAAARLWLALDCFRLGLPLFVWQRRRPTRLGLAIVLAVTIVALAAQRARYGERRTHQSHTSVNAVRP